jgi:hypothetical protein
MQRQQVEAAGRREEAHEQEFQTKWYFSRLTFGLLSVVFLFSFFLAFGLSYDEKGFKIRRSPSHGAAGIFF